MLLWSHNILQIYVCLHFLLLLLTCVRNTANTGINVLVAILFPSLFLLWCSSWDLVLADMNLKHSYVCLYRGTELWNASGSQMDTEGIARVCKIYFPRTSVFLSLSQCNSFVFIATKQRKVQVTCTIFDKM